MNLAFLSTKSLPAHFYDLLIPHSDLNITEEFTTLSSGKAWRVTQRSTRKFLVLKTVLDGETIATVYSSYCNFIVSLLSARFYFLAPIQGFTSDPPLGVLYTSYTACRTLRSLISSKEEVSPTNLSLIAAFLCYGMAYLELNQIAHTTFHSGNIYINDRLMPIITDYGLARTYDYFKDDKRNDEISWIAPELLLGHSPSYSVDVYSFGILLFEISEGERPWSNMTNLEYLTALKLGLLGEFKFSKAPPDWQNLIQECTDRDPDKRPSLFQLFRDFQKGKYILPYTDKKTFRAIIEQYPIQWLLAPESPPPDEKVTLISGREILADPQHQQFEEYIQYLQITIPIEKVALFCEIISQHLSGDHLLARFLLAAVAAIAQRGPEFHEAVVSSSFLSKLRVRSIEQADIVLVLLIPVFTTSQKLLSPSLFQAFAGLFVYHPNEALNLISQYIRSAKKLSGRLFSNLMSLYLGLWSLFIDSQYGNRYLKVLWYVYRQSPKFQSKFGRELSGVVTQFQNSKVNATALDLFYAHLSPTAITRDEQLRLVSQAPNWNHNHTILLHIPTIHPSPEMAQALVSHAYESSNPRSWAILLKYAGTDEPHGRTILEISNWFNPNFIDESFRLLLVLFVHEGLRKNISRTREFIEILTSVISHNNFGLLSAVYSLLERSNPDADYVAFVSQSGLLKQFLQVTFESSSDQVIWYGIRIVDFFAKFAWVEEWKYAVESAVSVFPDKSQTLGEELIRLMSTLSVFPPCIQYLKRQDFCKYFAQLQNHPQYGAHARIVLGNALRQ